MIELYTSRKSWYQRRILFRAGSIIELIVVAISACVDMSSPQSVCPKILVKEVAPARRRSGIV
ncbi:hypothetical protein CLAFUR0_20112 [Fulvia fulva]|nr:hypothetical protein CLAFUR0_20112 [Fulvia fulva]